MPKTGISQLPRITTLCALITSLPCVAADPATPPVGTPLSVTLDENLAYDSNPYRLPDDSVPPGQSEASHRSDWYSITRLNLEYAYRTEGNSLTLRAAPSIARYQRFSQLDNERGEYSVRWQVTPRERTINNMAYSHIRMPSNIADQQTTQLNMVTTDIANATVVLGAGARWQPLFGVSASRYTNSESSLRDGDREGWSAETGLRNLSPNGNSADLRYRYSSYRYPERIASQLSDNAYKQSELESNLEWLVSGSSRLSARINYQDRKHDTFPERDFSGWTGYLRHSWNPNDISTTNVELYRQLGEVSDASASYAKTSGVRFSYRWKAGAKLSLTPSVDWRERNYNGFSTTARPKERTTLLALLARYEIAPTVILDTSVGRETRQSDNVITRYAANYISALLTWKIH
jgi:hypothetical protein